MKFTLWDYQQAWCRIIAEVFSRGIDGQRFRRLLATAATGAGKTIMASALIWFRVHKLGQRCLFLADSDELCDQAIQKLLSAAGIIADLEKADSRASMKSKVVVASIQTLQKASRLERFPKDHFGFVLADEAHLSLADGWQRVLNYFDADVLGVTATPERADRISLMRFYEHHVADVPMKLLLDRLQLTPIVVDTVPLEISIHAEVKDSGEEDEGELSEELSAYHDAIIDALEERAADRKAILAFHPGRIASNEFTKKLQKRGHAAAHVDGASKNRKEILEAFHLGHIRFLNNAKLLIKGYDEPKIDCLVPLRPTRSRTEYIQEIGRGTRLYCPHGCKAWCDHPERKKDCKVIDFLWDFTSHNVMGPADIFTDNPEQREEVKKKLRAQPLADLAQIDSLVIGEREKSLIKKLRKTQGRKGATFDARVVGAMLHQPDLMDYQPTAKWESAKPSPKQLAALQKFGVDVSAVKHRGLASKLLDSLISRAKGDLATLRQLAALGDEADANLTFKEASQAISAKWNP